MSTSMPDIHAYVEVSDLIQGLNPHFPDELVNRCPEMEIML